MGLLNPPLNWTPDKTLTKLLDEVFVPVYHDKARASFLTNQLGPEHIDIVPVTIPNIKLFWVEVFKELANRGELRRLVELVKVDISAAAPNYQSVIKAALVEDSQDKPAGLTLKERNDLKTAFSQTFSMPDKFRKLVETGLNLDPDIFLSSTGSTNEAIAALISYCEEEIMLAELFAVPVKLPELEEGEKWLLNLAIENVQDTYNERMSKPIVNNPFEACFLNMGIPFIDRPGIRKSAQELIKEGGKRLLVVNGDPGTGKTHSQWFIELLGDRYDFEYCFIELEEEGPGSFNADDLALRLDSDLPLPAHPDQPAIPEKLTDPGKWPAKISNWLVKKLTLYDTYCWIALDGFSHEELPESTRELVARLVNAVKGSRLPHVRLVLLDYPPGELGPFPFIEREDIEIVDKDKLGDYLIKAVEEKNLPVNSVKLRQKAAEITDSLSDNNKNHMLEIMLKVTEFLNGPMVLD